VRRPVLAAAVALLAVPLAACSGGTSHSTRCTNDVCAVFLSGEQTLEVEFGAFERDLRVAPIEPGAVTVSAQGDDARLAPGEVGIVGGLQVQLVTVSGRDVTLQVAPA
jgi:hypothetical protein